VGARASGVAHNFNNIIDVILGYTEMARERNTPSRILDDIRRAGERAHEPAPPRRHMISRCHFDAE
jgi:hypothetical protein